MSVGMVIMRPTSIVVAGAGSSASIRAAGGVEFATATSLSLNGVFTSDFDDYMITMRYSNDSADQGVFFRVRTAGTDATGSNYVRQELLVSSTTVSGDRKTSQTSVFIGTSSDDQKDGCQLFLYGPNLAQPTAGRSVTADGILGARITDNAFTHSLSTAYDGFTIFPNSGSFTGQLTVFGFAQ